MRIELNFIPPFAYASCYESCILYYFSSKLVLNFKIRGGQSGVDKQAQKSGIKINDQFAQWLS